MDLIVRIWQGGTEHVNAGHGADGPEAITPRNPPTAGKSIFAAYSLEVKEWRKKRFGKKV